LLAKANPKKTVGDKQFNFSAEVSVTKKKVLWHWHREGFRRKVPGGKKIVWLTVMGLIREYKWGKYHCAIPV
jgi:hypothetical protein